MKDGEIIIDDFMRPLIEIFKEILKAEDDEAYNKMKDKLALR